VTTDLRSAQITVVVPRRVADPRGRWAMTAAVGLWDRDAKGWLLPVEQRTQTQPGGAPRGGRTNGIFNVAPRLKEPVRERGTPPTSSRPGPSRATRRRSSPTRWTSTRWRAG
jgi:hypothetical protein